MVAVSLIGLLAGLVAPREVLVQVLNSEATPQPGVEVVLCRSFDEPCYGLQVTNAKGIATFPGVTGTELMVTAGLGPCASGRTTLDLSKFDLTKPVPLVLADTATFTVVLNETAAGGKAKPIAAKNVEITFHPRPPRPHGSEVRQFLFQTTKKPGEVDCCVRAGVDYDVQVKAEGFYLASSRESSVPPNGTRKVTLTLRRKPASTP